MKRDSEPDRAPADFCGWSNQRLSMYALAASAAGVGVLALAQPTQARVVFTPAHVKITPNHHLFLDLNHDGIKDFELTNAAAGSSEFVEVHALQSGNGLAQASGDCNPSVGVAALLAGVQIGKGQVFSHNLYCMAQYIGADGGSLGPWAGGVKNRFLGFQFTVKGRTHFGWARLSVTPAPFTEMLTGYAYETIPNKPIVAGKKMGSEGARLERASLGHLAKGVVTVPEGRRK